MGNSIMAGNSNNTTNLLLIILIAVIAIGGYLYYENTRPKTTGEKIGEAVESVGNDIQDATN